MLGRTWWGRHARPLGRAGTNAGSGRVPHEDQVDRVDADNGKEICLRILGRVEVSRRRGSGEHDITNLFTPKQQELLVCLAVSLQHGIRRDLLNNAMWPACPATRPYNSLHNALSVIRRAIVRATDGAVTVPITRADDTYKINLNVVEVDYWQFRSALHPEVPGCAVRVDRCQRAAALYRGDLAENLTSLWIETPREAVRREILDALSILVQEGPKAGIPQAIGLLEQIRKTDRYNEGIYREIMTAQAALGQVEATIRTFGLLVKALKEIGQHPGRETLAIVTDLRSKSFPRVAS